MSKIVNSMGIGPGSLLLLAAALLLSSCRASPPPAGPETGPDSGPRVGATTALVQVAVAQDAAQDAAQDHVEQGAAGPDPVEAAPVEPDPVEPDPVEPDLLELGWALYRANCALCHGDNGGRGAAPLNVSAPQLDDAAIAGFIIEGVPAKGMPGLGYLSGEELAAVIAFMRSWGAP
jgi:mono/diheme cytochrome c family protein